MRPTLAVLITYYNEREMLTRCLESLLSQPERPDEVWVYDDASPEPASQYLVPGFPIHVLRGETNIGPSRGRNCLLRATSADYIHFHDTDDWFMPEWCSRVRSCLNNAAPDIVFTEITAIGNGQVRSPRVLELSELVNYPDLVTFAIHGAILPGAGTYRRERVAMIGGYRESLWQSEDYDFHVRLAATQPTFVILGDPLVVTDRHGNGRSEDQVSVWSCALEANEQLQRELPAKYQMALAEKNIVIGTFLLRLGAVKEARRAFDLAKQWGPPTYAQQRRLQRTLSKTLGPESAERAAQFYRSRIPVSLRRYLSRSGW